jgi:F0F1-type ATP synthase membrane subunit b/b'
MYLVANGSGNTTPIFLKKKRFLLFLFVIYAMSTPAFEKIVDELPETNK